MRVLIADDHPLYREAAALQIRRLYREAHVQEVASLDELRAATDLAPVFDLILVDYFMPGMSADGLAGLVKDFPSTPLSHADNTAEPVRPAQQMGCGLHVP